MNNFETRFNRTRKMINVGFVLMSILVIAIFVGAIFLGWQLIHHPETIGAFFGKIVNGFNSIK